MRPRSAAVLLCNPFGEEAARAHRIYRVLATQLERSGYPVLRFDYFGTGDSMGESSHVSVDRWLDDIGLAANELTAAVGARKLVAIGLRLGGTLAALSASRDKVRLRHLVLWDPVVSGAGYLEELAEMHRAYTLHELGSLAQPTQPRTLANGIPTEALGTPISASLAAELGSIDLTTETLRADHATVISTADSPAIARLRTQLAESPSVRWIDLPKSSEWNSDAALNASTVPMDVIQTVVSRVEELSP
jgi:pimeloyl-ACP methyl ester carboxylesterase